MDKILNILKNSGIIPVIKIEEECKAIPLARALIDGGLPLCEITFRTSCAKQAIKNITTEFKDMLVGAGTILTIEQVKAATNAGAKFIISPGLNPKTAEYCLKNGILIIPGCSSASDIEIAIELGLKVVKFFPSENLGGLKMIKALAAPYSSINFVPTGGINEHNINEYLAFDKILACGGTYMVSENYIKNDEFHKITEKTRESILNILGFSLAHIGFNHENKEEAEKAAKKFKFLFGFTELDKELSIFSSTYFEHMKFLGKGKLGHIAISTNSVQRAVYYLQNNGIEFDETTKKIDDNGKIMSIYFKDEMLGFAIHLLQNR